MEQRSSDALRKAREFQVRQMEQHSVGQRPVFHLVSPVGWMNDPNGFSWFQDRYHLFFQYHPYAMVWGPMHWGHCTSEDLIRWQVLPVAIAPDQPYDEGGCYSGSAIEVNGEHVLFYTGIIDHQQDGEQYYRQVQCIAKGDGVAYHKWEGNPVLTGESLPQGSSLREFRDPKVWKEEDGYYLIAGNIAEDASGQVVMYRSENLYDWHFVSVLDRSFGQYGKMWECPDFFRLGEKQILMVSPQYMKAKGLEFHAGNNVAFLVGKYDKSSFHFEREAIHSADYGLDFYAAQTVLTKDGRRVLIGWMQSWDAKIVPKSLGWSGMMSIPRELSLRNGRVYQQPVRELERYRSGKVEYQGLTIKGGRQLEGVRGRVLDLQVEITAIAFDRFAVHFAKNEEYEVVLEYNHAKGWLLIDRTNAGIERDVVCRRKMEAHPMENGTLTLRILLDRYSAEVFVNGGERVMSNAFYTPLEAEGITFTTDGTATLNVTKYDIRV